MFFIDNNDTLYSQPQLVNNTRYSSEFPVYAGEKNMLGDSIANSPRDFTFKNAIPLDELHDMLVSIILPESRPDSVKFRLTDDDYNFLYKVMSQYPGESIYPPYSDDYYDSYVKLLMFGASKDPIPDNIRIFNKTGMAYGFLTETDYIVDFDKGIEFFLSVTIYVDSDGVINDGKYDYENVGIPFLDKLGKEFYRMESKRKNLRKPDLSKLESIEYN